MWQGLAPRIALRPRGVVSADAFRALPELPKCVASAPSGQRGPGRKKKNSGLRARRRAARRARVPSAPSLASAEWHWQCRERERAECTATANSYKLHAHFYRMH